MTAYRLALRWLLDFTAAGIPPPSSIAQYFWSAPLQLTSQYWSPGPRKALQSVIAYPMFFFNVNNVGNIALLTVATASDLPDEHHTRASVASPFTKIVVSHDMFILFVVLEVLLTPQNACAALATAPAAANMWILRG